jgi:hypothetical protein
MENDRSPRPYVSPQICPANQNYDFDFVRNVLMPNHVSVVVVENQPSTAFFKQTRFAREIGDGLWRTWLGRFDGSRFSPVIQNFFHVHTRQLREALEFIQIGLKERGLLETSKIGYADAELEVWRTFYPSIGEVSI